MSRILVVDDDKGMLKLLKNLFEKDGHLVTPKNNTRNMSIEEFKGYDIILLDIMMSGEDGIEACIRIREYVESSIIFLTAKSMENDVVNGLGAGADDYITKPFGVKEIRARVNAHLRREKRDMKSGFSVSGIFFDTRGEEASIDGNRIKFTRGEYMICKLLAENKGQTFSKDRIYDRVFGFDGTSDSSCITEHIKNIRFKLKKEGINTIETIWGIGYRWR